MRHVVKALAKMEATSPYIYVTNAADTPGVPPSVVFIVQSDPISEVGVNGCQAVDMLEYVKHLFESLNETFPCRENAITITKLDEALMWQERRTKNRRTQGVEGFNKPHSS